MNLPTRQGHFFLGSLVWPVVYSISSEMTTYGDCLSWIPVFRLTSVEALGFPLHVQSSERWANAKQVHGDPLFFSFQLDFSSLNNVRPCLTKIVLNSGWHNTYSIKLARPMGIKLRWLTICPPSTTFKPILSTFGNTVVINIF